MDNRKVQKLYDLNDKRNKNKIIQEAFKEIEFNKKGMPQIIISFFISLVLAIIISTSDNTVLICRELISAFNEIFLAFLAVIFGSYAIFQALLSKSIVKELLEADGNLLHDSNKSFLNLIIMYVIGIVCNLFIKAVLLVIPEDFTAFPNIIICEIFSGVLILTYAFFSLLLIMEMINFVINLYRMFCVYNTLNALDDVDNDDH